MLATGPKVRGVQTRQRTMNFKGDKTGSTTSFGREVKPAVAYRKVKQHLKDPYNMRKIIRLQAKFMDFLVKLLLLC
jgi:hypothetical protein